MLIWLIIFVESSGFSVYDILRFFVYLLCRFIGIYEAFSDHIRVDSSRFIRGWFLEDHIGQVTDKWHLKAVSSLCEIQNLVLLAFDESTSYTYIRGFNALWCLIIIIIMNVVNSNFINKVKLIKRLHNTSGYWIKKRGYKNRFHKMAIAN